ncbi:hypothetical protein AJ88_40950 [Mesorhizobium amorphae CCBAU 01583]|nr:hypothetical protein AJ88_40950 [Mesorhizobium amorphae CCBAU 01583]
MKHGNAAAAGADPWRGGCAGHVSRSRAFKATGGRFDTIDEAPLRRPGRGIIRDRELPHLAAAGSIPAPRGYTKAKSGRSADVATEDPTRLPGEGALFL